MDNLIYYGSIGVVAGIYYLWGGFRKTQDAIKKEVDPYHNWQETFTIPLQNLAYTAGGKSKDLDLKNPTDQKIAKWRVFRISVQIYLFTSFAIIVVGIVVGFIVSLLLLLSGLPY